MTHSRIAPRMIPVVVATLVAALWAPGHADAQAPPAPTPGKQGDTDKKVTLPGAPAGKAPNQPGASATPGRPAIKMPIRAAALAAQQRPVRWTGATPDAMVRVNLVRARRSEPEALAALLVVNELHERAQFGLARNGINQVGRGKTPFADDARWLSRTLLPRHAPPPWNGLAQTSLDVEPNAGGHVEGTAVLGPFEDSGGGLMRPDGPEGDGSAAAWSDIDARYSWGAYDVAWRRTLPRSHSARGLPLDLYIHPRRETCSYVASVVELPPQAEEVQMWIGSTGSVRVIWDGQTVASDEEAHERLVLDRLAVELSPSPGPHLVAIKTCSSALGDEGRVRVRFTDADRKPMAVKTSSDLTTLPDAWSAPSTAKRITTPLEQATNVGDQPKREDALVAAIVRTLAGADDLRSKRAPGLLDRVARDPDVTADELAIAGWISPFGANRSGWLNNAWEKAEASSDLATAAFCQRRLVASQLAARQVDWAYATMARPPLAKANDPEAKLTRAIAMSSQNAAGLSRRALEDLLELKGALKARTPLAVRREIIDMSRGRPRLQHREMRELSSLLVDARGPGFVESYAVMGAPAYERAVARSVEMQQDATALVSMGQSLLRRGRSTWAREVLALATYVAPNLASAHEGLARAQLAYLQERRERGEDIDDADAEVALTSLARAIDLEPSNVLLKAELQFRTQPPPEPSDAPAEVGVTLSGERDEKHLVDPAVFLAKAKDKPFVVGEVSDRQLHWVRVVTYHDDKRVSQLMQYAREIVVEPRTQFDLEEQEIPMEGDETELLIARVHKKDGSVVPAEEQSVGGYRPYVRWPKLERGDVVEIAVRAWTAEPVGRRGDPPYYFIDYVGSTETRPVLYNEVVVDVPPDAPFAIDVLNGKPDRTLSSKEGDREIRRFIWDNPPTLPDEPFAPRPTESLPLVVGSTYAGWDSFRTWYQGAIEGFSEPDDQVRRLALELTKDARTRDEKIEALFNFVADDIRYVNYVSGEWWLPNRPQQLLARRQGDCDDKAMLLISMLDVIGVKATPVLVQTRLTGMPSLLSSKKVAVPMFDHGIAYIPDPTGKGPGTWLDATTPQSRMGPLPAMDARARAFFVEQGPAEIIETPPSSPDEHGVDASWTLKLTPDGGGTLSATEKHRGDSAFFLRMSLREEDARAQYLEQMLGAGWFSSVVVDPNVSFDGDGPKGTATLKYAARSDLLARREGSDLTVSIGGTRTLTSQLAPLVKRTLPVVIPPQAAPMRQDRSLRIEAPVGYSFADLPPGGTVEGGPFGSARLAFRKVGPRAVEVERSIVLDQSTIPATEYASWRSFLQRVDGLMNRAIRLVPSK